MKSGSRWLWIAVVACVGWYLCLHGILDKSLFTHDPWDSYTLQAQAWWHGRATLDHDYSHLELAKYRDAIYVSFPPVPSIVMFALLPIFGLETPNALLVTLYAIAAFALVFSESRRRGAGQRGAALWACALILGSSVLPISLCGGVWFQAQVLNFLLLVACIVLLSRRTKAGIFWGLVCFALALGCRPHDVFFAPLVFFLAFPDVARLRWRETAGMLWLPILILVGYAAYNFVRFDHPLEFGHTYLPEFLEDPLGQFHWRHAGENFRQLMRWPTWSAQEGVVFPRFNGFAFYLANPVFISLALAFARNRRRLNRVEVYFLGGALVQFVFLLCHRTNGGWHFGTRYMVDMLPFVWLVILGRHPRPKIIDYALTAFGMALNAYGAYFIYRT